MAQTGTMAASTSAASAAATGAEDGTGKAGGRRRKE